MASSSKRSEECNRLVFEAVNESSVSKLKLVISTYSESDILVSFAKCNEKGENPLVVAIKGKTVAKLLIAFLQRCKRLTHDKCHPVPLNAFDELSHQICIMELIEQLTLGLPLEGDITFTGTVWLKFLAQVFIKSTSFSREDKIIALELIGALLHIELPMFVEFVYSLIQPGDFGLRLLCWREAMTLRYFPADGEPLLPKISYIGVQSVESAVVFGSALEVMSMEELDLFERHLYRDFITSELNERLPFKKQMQRQALLVIRRITSQSNSEHPSSLYLKSLLKFGTELLVDNQRNLGYSADNKLIINIYLLILEQATGCDPIVLPRKWIDVFISTLHQISVYFFKMLRQPPDSPGSKELSYANLLMTTRFFDTIGNVFPAMISSLRHDPGVHYDLEGLIFKFVFVLDSISARLSSQEKQHLEECYSKYIRNLFPERTPTVLHAAIFETMPCHLRGDFRLAGYGTVENLRTTVKHLLKLGADPNAIDEYGQTPLHFFAVKEKIHLEENVALFQALVDAGFHLDIAADNGNTVLDILKRKKEMFKDRGVAVNAYFSSLITTVFPLSCYCARVIRRHGIRYDEDRLPIHLQEFVTRHSAKDANDLPEDDNHVEN